MKQPWLVEMNSSIVESVERSLQEDIGQGDITAQLLPDNTIATARIISKEPAIVCGIQWADCVYQQLDPTIKIEWQVKEGQHVNAGDCWAIISGPVRALVTGERCALNWLQTLSGTATTVAEYMKQLESTRTQLLDTRKTIPGLRIAQKHAVAVGGGRNHRIGLFDAFLIKENHIMACGSIAHAITTARQQHANKPVEVEVETMGELKQAIEAGADIVMLDNFDLDGMCEAVRLNGGRVKLEVSGNVELNTVRDIAQTGVDFISVGALTKHVRAVDLSMRLVE